MIESLSPALFATFAFGALIFFLCMFLPALFAVQKKRTVEEKALTDEKRNCQLKIAPMERMDEDEVDNFVVRRLAEVIAVLPDIES